MVTYEAVKDKNTVYAGDCFILITIKVDCKNIFDSADSLLFLLYAQLLFWVHHFFDEIFMFDITSIQSKR